MKQNERQDTCMLGEARRMKAEMEAKIAAMFEQYANETGLFVTDVQPLMTDGAGQVRRVKITIEVC